MNVQKRETATYVLSGLEELDPVTVYVTNYGEGVGKLVVECYGEAWAAAWSAMGEKTLERFVLSCDEDYLLNSLLKRTVETDYEALCAAAGARGLDLCVTSDVEVAQRVDDLASCFGEDWYMDLPTCPTAEYHHLRRILEAVKRAFSEEL